MMVVILSMVSIILGSVFYYHFVRPHIFKRVFRLSSNLVLKLNKADKVLIELKQKFVLFILWFII